MHPCTNTSKPITVTDAMVYIYIKRGCFPRKLHEALSFFSQNSKNWCFVAEEYAFKKEVLSREGEKSFKSFLEDLIKKGLLELVNVDDIPPMELSEEQYRYLNELKKSYQNDRNGLYRHCKLALFLNQNFQTEILTYDKRAIPIIKKLGLKVSNHLMHQLSRITGLP